MTNTNRNHTRHNNAQTSQKNEHADRFQFISSGIGYLNNLAERESSKNGKLFTTCTIAVLTGLKETEKRQYRYVDVVVVGDKNLDLIWQYQQDIEEQSNVLIKFLMSDMTAEAFERKDGTLGASLKSYLFAIEKVWVNNELTYDARPKEEPTASRNQPRARSNAPRRQGQSATQPKAVRHANSHY